MKNKKIKCRKDESHEPRYTDRARFCQECGAGTYRIQTFIDEVRAVVRSASIDIANIVGGISREGIKSATKLTFKATTYPIIGNLTYESQRGLERRVGREWFNANNATTTSALTNLITYPAMFNLLFNSETYSNPIDAIYSHVIGAMAVVSAGYLRSAVSTGYLRGTTFRTSESKFGPEPVRVTEGTWLGTLASLPIKTAIKTYGIAKNYVGLTIVRDKNRRKKQENEKQNNGRRN